MQQLILQLLFQLPCVEAEFDSNSLPFSTLLKIKSFQKGKGLYVVQEVQNPHSKSPLMKAKEYIFT